MAWPALALGAIGAALAAVLAVRRGARHAGARTLLRRRARVDRYKLARRSYVRAELLADRSLAEAVRQYAAERGLGERSAWDAVDHYIDEIVPAFNVLAYYKFGYAATRVLLGLLYEVDVEYEDRAANERLPRDAVPVYLINHRSNADYLLVGYALAGEVAISYAVGEWARVFPLDRIFKAFGAYFVRRRFRDSLYHAVLEHYVQLITRRGVTQGIFPEGGLSRDGRMRPAKIGLLDYILGVARDPAFRDRLHVVPVALNYDRVLEDRSLLRELASSEGRPTPSRLRELWGVARYLWWNSGRLALRRWRRYGRAAVTIGRPIPLAPWLADPDGGGSLFSLPRPERLARVQALADGVMSKIGALIPVTPVSLACAALQSLDRDFVLRSGLLARMMEMRDVLVGLNARVVRDESDMERTLERALRLLLMRRVLAPEGDGFAVLPRGRPLISYYANSVAHLLGPFEAGVRERDALPALLVTGEHAALPA